MVELVSDPVEWYDRERGTLVSAVPQAAQAGLTELFREVGDDQGIALLALATSRSP